MSESVKHYKPVSLKAQAIADIEALIKGGSTVRTAVEDVAYRTGISERSLFTYLAKTRGMKIEEREAALERKRREPRPRVICHPEAMKLAVDLCRKGDSMRNAYQRTLAEAKAKGWEPIPLERTFYRQLDQIVPWNDRWAARRSVKPSGEV